MPSSSEPASSRAQNTNGNAFSESTSSSSTVTIAEMQTWLNDFAAARNWERFHTPKSLSMSIAIEAAELMEHFQWTANDTAAGTVAYDSPIAEEMADVLSYTLQLASVLGIDLADALRAKMIKNAQKYPAAANES